MQADTATAGGPVDDEVLEERQKLARLARWVGLFFAFPGLSIGLAFVLFEDPSEHSGHITLSLGFGIAGVFLALASRRIADRYQG